MSIQAYPDRLQAIRHPAGDELAEDKKTHPVGGKSLPMVKLSPLGRELTSNTRRRPTGDELPPGFSPQLSWSHYRALMRLQDDEESRAFYEQEAIECGWSKAQLER